MTSPLPALRQSSLSVEGGVAEFSHQRPQARNALSLPLRADYADLLDFIETTPAVRVLIITGSGGSFCAGGDVKAMHERLANTDPEVNSPDAQRRRMVADHRWLSRLRNLQVPVVAAVEGPAYGAGFGLALMADFVLASSSASFCMSFAKVGLVPDFGALYTLPRIVGMSVAKELMMTARRVAAAEAQQLGFVHAVHEAAELLPKARRLAQRLAAGPRDALALTKSLLNKSFENDYATMAEMESMAQGVAMATPFHAQAVARFAQGEAPLYDWDRPAPA